jgi:hypothetical protein
VVGGFAWGTKGGEGPNEDAEEGEGESEGKSKREGEPLLRIREEAMRVNIPRAFAYYDSCPMSSARRMRGVSEEQSVGYLILTCESRTRGRSMLMRDVMRVNSVT